MYLHAYAQALLASYNALSRARPLIGVLATGEWMVKDWLA
jgi:hypothetical protein